MKKHNNPKISKPCNRACKYMKPALREPKESQMRPQLCMEVETPFLSD